MFRTLITTAVFIAYMIVRRTQYFWRVTIRRRRPETFMADWVRSFTGLIMAVTGIRLRVSGRENLEALPRDRPVVVVSNHESYLDIPCAMAAVERPLGFVAKRELSRIPLLGFWIRALGGALINREDLRASHATLTKGIAAEPERWLLVFPEGTRNKAGSVAPFKPGSFRLALEKRAVILPLCVTGARRKFEGNGYRMRAGEIRVEILPPADTAGVSAQEKRRFAERLHDLILAAHEPRRELPPAGADTIAPLSP